MGTSWRLFRSATSPCPRRTWRSMRSGWRSLVPRKSCLKYAQNLSLFRGKSGSWWYPKFTLIRFYLGLNVTHSASDLALTTQFNHLKYYLLDLSEAGNEVKNKFI